MIAADTTPAASRPNGPSSAEPAPAPLTPEMAEKIGQLRSKIQLSVGQVVLALMNTARYRNLSLADLATIIMEPLLRDRVAIARKSAKAADGTTHIDEHTIAGIAIWATVSNAVDAKIIEQVRAGVFPVRLAAEDWTSGDTPDAGGHPKANSHVWLLDVIAADRHEATGVLVNFRQLAGERPVKIHPIVGQMIEPGVLGKLMMATEKSATAVSIAASTQP